MANPTPKKTSSKGLMLKQGGIWIMEVLDDGSQMISMVEQDDEEPNEALNAWAQKKGLTFEDRSKESWVCDHYGVEASDVDWKSFECKKLARKIARLAKVLATENLQKSKPFKDALLQGLSYGSTVEGFIDEFKKACLATDKNGIALSLESVFDLLPASQFESMRTDWITRGWLEIGEEDAVKKLTRSVYKNAASVPDKLTWDRLVLDLINVALMDSYSVEPEEKVQEYSSGSHYRSPSNLSAIFKLYKRLDPNVMESERRLFEGLTKWVSSHAQVLAFREVLDGDGVVEKKIQKLLKWADFSALQYEGVSEALRMMHPQIQKLKSTQKWAGPLREAIKLDSVVVMDVLLQGAQSDGVDMLREPLIFRSPNEHNGLGFSTLFDSALRSDASQCVSALLSRQVPLFSPSQWINKKLSYAHCDQAALSYFSVLRASVLSEGKSGSAQALSTWSTLVCELATQWKQLHPGEPLSGIKTKLEHLGKQALGKSTSAASNASAERALMHTGLVLTDWVNAGGIRLTQAQNASASSPARKHAPRL